MQKSTSFVDCGKNRGHSEPLIGWFQSGEQNGSGVTISWSVIEKHST